VGIAVPFFALIFSVSLLCYGCQQSTEEAPARQLRTSSGNSAQKTPGGLNLHNRLGKQHLGARRYNSALESFQAALSGGEDSVRAYAGLSQAYQGLGNLEQAEATLNRASSLDTTRAEIAYARAEFYLDRHIKTHQGLRLEQALIAARKAVQLDPGQKAYFYALGSIYTHRGNLEQAEVAYRQALALDPDLVAVFDRLGSLYKYQGRFAEAEKAYGQVLERHLEDVRALYELAILYRMDGRLAKAREFL